MEIYSTAIGKLKNLEKLALEFYKYAYFLIKKIFYQSNEISEKGAEHLSSALAKLENSKKIVLEFYE